MCGEQKPIEMPKDVIKIIECCVRSLKEKWLVEISFADFT